MSRDARAARALGLWTAAWLAVLLVAGLLWVGDPSVQWPVLLVPLLWAAVAARPRRRPHPAEDDWRPVPEPASWQRPAPAMRTDTVQRPALRRGHEPDGRRRSR